MPNIASVLKDEILRLARKEVKAETEALKKASAHYRSEIAGLKRRVTSLESHINKLSKKALKQDAAQASSKEASRVRFSAKGFASRRQRLGLSAADLGALLGISAQTVYNWESGKTRPRPQQLEALAATRTMGKRQAKAQLEAATGGAE
jgi:DNA-binding transcriptional regulator YiaG